MRWLVGVLVATLIAGCQSQTKSPARSGLDYVVTERSTAFDRVRAGGTDLSPLAVRSLAPLPAARTFPPSADPVGFGLDHPQMTLSYERAGVVVVAVDIGAANFDGHGYYARRTGDPRIFLVLREALLPAFREAGISAAPVPDGS